MNYCQRVLTAAEDFRVIQFPEEHDEPVCGKPAQFKAKFEGEPGEIVEMWLCAECADEYESRFRISWGFGSVGNVSEEAE